MEIIYIPNLIHAPDQTYECDIQERLEGLDSLTPVTGKVQVVHNGNFLGVKAIAETIVTLTCDRCLCQYNHRLQINASELIWLQEDIIPSESPEEEIEVEVTMDDLVETLPPKGNFNPGAWLYEQLCLAIPQRQLCDTDCPGIAVETKDVKEESLQPVDQRWAALQALKNNLPN